MSRIILAFYGVLFPFLILSVVIAIITVAAEGKVTVITCSKLLCPIPKSSQFFSQNDEKLSLYVTKTLKFVGYKILMKKF